MRRAIAAGRERRGAAALIAGWAALAALGIPRGWGLWIAATPIAAASLAWVLAKPRRFVLLFACVLALTPPLPGLGSEQELHAAPLLLPIGLLSALVWKRDWQFRKCGIFQAFTWFTAAVFASIGWAALAGSGAEATGSAVRAGLLAMSGLLLAWSRFGPEETPDELMADARFLFRCAVAAAALAFVDFALQWPAPAHSSPQFVWLDSGVFRRAQGLFYDASTLGNFCAFFLVLVIVAARRSPGRRLVSRVELVLGATVLGTALVLSFSRGSVVNLLVAAGAFFVLNGARAARRAGALVLGLAGAAATAAAVFPEFAQSYWLRLTASVEYASSSPNGVLSGRLTSWSALGHFVASEPWRMVTGIGYKMLPSAGLDGTAVIGDNTYLTLLVETGVVGLILFLLLNARIVRETWRAAKARSETAAFFGSWMLCFWIGQLVQMLSGDLITYWRVLPIYFWVLGVATRQAQAE